jgi:hypothetical protein
MSALTNIGPVVAVAHGAVTAPPTTTAEAASS